MKFMIQARFPTEAGNKMAQNPNIQDELKAYVQSIKAEAAYFFESCGERTVVFIANIESADQMPLFAEPLFMKGANVELHPVMTLKDHENAMANLKK